MSPDPSAESAAVLAWQQTVETTWQQLAAGGATGGISLRQLEAIMPNLPPAKAAQYLPYLNAAMAQAGITTPARQAAFLAQIAEESAQLTEFEEVGNGAEYRGRGPIQLTGRANYQAAGNALGVDLVDNPELAAQPSVGFRTAAWYWTTHNLNAAADAGDFRGITRAINGGYNGEAAREQYYARAKQALGVG